MSLTDNLDLLDLLRERWQSDAAIHARVNAWVEHFWQKRRSKVRRAIRLLWRDHRNHWIGVYAELYREALEDAESPEAAHLEALEMFRDAFITSLEAQLTEELDRRLTWAFIGNPAWRATLERIDGTLIATLISAARVSVQLGLRKKVKLLTAGADQVAEEIAELLADFTLPEEPAPAEPEPSRPGIRPEPLQRIPGRDAILGADGVTLQDIEEAPEEPAVELEDLPDDEDTAEEANSDGDEEHTLITRDPTVAPSAVAARERLKTLTGGAARRAEKEAAEEQEQSSLRRRASRLLADALPALPTTLGGE